MTQGGILASPVGSMPAERPAVRRRAQVSAVLLAAAHGRPTTGQSAGKSHRGQNGTSPFTL